MHYITNNRYTTYLQIHTIKKKNTAKKNLLLKLPISILDALLTTLTSHIT